MKHLYRITLLLMLVLLAAACGEATSGSLAPTELPAVPSVGAATTLPVSSEPTGGPANTAIVAEPTPLAAADSTVAVAAPSPETPALPEVVPADPTATKAAGVKPSLIFFTADN